MCSALQDKTVLVVGRGSGIARAVTLGAVLFAMTNTFMTGMTVENRRR